MTSQAPTPIRWRLAEDEESERLFGEEVLSERHVGKGEFAGMEFLHVNARRIVNKVPAKSRVPFRFTLNAYRGCSHACIYCFARPTHEYLGLNIGEDFDRRIVVKVNAVERLRSEIVHPLLAGEHIAMGTNTDPYQAAEGKYHLTQGIIEVLSERGHPFSILTKSTLILRDLRSLVEASARTDVTVNLSVGTLDREVWKLSEPGTPPPDKRLEVVKRLNDAGVRCGVLVAPVLPGLSDSDEQLAEIGAACARAGAVSVSAISLHLRGAVRDHYMAVLGTRRPELVSLYEKRFARSSYQPDGEQERVTATVRRAFEAAGGKEPVFEARSWRWTGLEEKARQLTRRAGRPAPLQETLF